MQYMCEQTNLYAAQNGREFVKNPEEIRVFLGINYIMCISKIPNLNCYWSVDRYFSNEGVRNAMTRDCFMKILQNLIIVVLLSLELAWKVVIRFHLLVAE